MNTSKESSTTHGGAGTAGQATATAQSGARSVAKDLLAAGLLGGPDFTPDVSPLPAHFKSQWWAHA